MLVYATPIFTVHNVQDAPEDLFIVLYVHQQHASDVVHALHIAYLTVVISICEQHVVEHLLAFLRLPIEVLALAFEILQIARVVSERPRYILAYSVLIVLVRQRLVKKLLVHARCVSRLFTLTATQHAPYVAAQIIWNAIQKRLANALP